MKETFKADEVESRRELGELLKPFLHDICVVIAVNHVNDNRLKRLF